MKTLIAYCTTHGCTGKTAIKLKDFLGDDVHLINLKQEKNPDLKEYEQVIIGGSIHAGQIQKRIKEFSIKNLDELQTKELG
ncbi:MAG: flavodoxin domain-containing protein, partial [Bacteroidota bacterium]